MGDRTGTVRLAEADIVAAALEIVHEAGVEGLTMRGLADRLDVSVAAAYKHVDDKPTLLRIAAAELFSRVEGADVDGDDWIVRVRLLMTRFYDVMSAYPGMSAYIALQPDEIPRLQVSERMREILVGAGFGADEAWDIMATFVFYCSGALDGPIGQMDLGEARAVILRGAYLNGLERILDGLRVALDRLHQ
jgi:AcrR family transcriptional regulator